MFTPTSAASFPILACLPGELRAQKRKPQMWPMPNRLTHRELLPFAMQAVTLFSVARTSVGLTFATGVQLPGPHAQCGACIDGQCGFFHFMW